MYNKYPICSIDRLRMGTDGEGIRTLILVQGCPLQCIYCINSFSWDGSVEPECLSAKDLYSKIILDRPYMLATKGGITFGGGEPLLYPEMISEMRSLCDKEISIYVETSLNVPWKNVEDSCQAIDKYYVDIKSMNSETYHGYTEGDLSVVIENLKKLLECKGSEAIVVRIPVIPDLVDKEEQKKSQELLRQMGIVHFDLFTYEKTF